MSTKKSFLIPGSDASKQEEITFIEKLALAIPDGTYLKDLFNPSLINWVREQIRNDFPPNVIENYFNAQHVESEAVLEFNKYQNNMRITVQNLESELETARKALDYQISRSNELLERYKSEGQQWEEMVMEAKRERFQMGVELHNIKEDLENREQTIVELKAKLYDLMVSKNTAEEK